MSLDKSATHNSENKESDLKDINPADADSSSEPKGPLDGLDTDSDTPDPNNELSISDNKRIMDK